MTWSSADLSYLRSSLFGQLSSLRWELGAKYKTFSKSRLKVVDDEVSISCCWRLHSATWVVRLEALNGAPNGARALKKPSHLAWRLLSDNKTLRRVWFAFSRELDTISVWVLSYKSYESSEIQASNQSRSMLGGARRDALNDLWILQRMKMIAKSHRSLLWEHLQLSPITARILP